MQNKVLVLVVTLVWIAAFGVSRADNSNPSLDSKAPPVDWHWTRLSLEADFPKPFGKVTIVINQSKKNFAPKVTGIDVRFNGHELHISKRLLKGIVLAGDPDIGYNTKKGKITSLFISFRYGYPVQKKMPYCSSTCMAYHVAVFVIDENYHVTKNDCFLPVRE